MVATEGGRKDTTVMTMATAREKEEDTDMEARREDTMVATDEMREDMMTSAMTMDSDT